MRRLLLVALLVPLAACASVRAKVPADRPTLDVPPPPPRVIEAAVPPETEPEPVADLPPTPTSPPARPRPSRERETAKPEVKPEGPVETPAPPQPVPAVPTPPPSQLRTPGTADPAGAAEAARQVNEVLGRANRMLGGVDYQTLKDERRKAYDQAKEFIQGAETALKEQNFVFARAQAEKAEKLARELQGR